MELSIRMHAVASMVTPGYRVADIGTDHAYVPVYLVQKQICPSALAMDVRKGPLSHAAGSIEKYGLGDLISTRLSDGMKELGPGEADSIIIAGMGGLLMIRILEDSCQLLDTIKELVLQPQSDFVQVRQFIHQIGWKIEREDMVIDKDKYYTMMRVIPGNDVAYNTEDDRFGKLLIDSGHPVLIGLLERELGLTDRIIDNLSKQSTEKSRLRLAQLLEEKESLLRAYERTKANRRNL